MFNMASGEDVTPTQIRERFNLEPMPLEGGFFRQTWRGPDVGGRPTGTAIVVLLSVEDDQFSAMHRLPTDEVWFFHAGDPVELLLLDPETGTSRISLLGIDVASGHLPQIVVPAGTWMGGSPKGPHGWSLFGCTMTPGFTSGDYTGASADALAADFPQAAAHIRTLCRLGAPLRHPAD